MPPKLSEKQIDDKFEELRAFAYDHVALRASCNGSSLKASFRQKASNDENAWYYFLNKHEDVFFALEKNTVLRIYAIMAEPAAEAAAGIARTTIPMSSRSERRRFGRPSRASLK